ncbi:MAG: acetolactate synthase small subunit [Rhodobacteraceae bacterium]|nr:acetolactate synthase small subunit [Paracoccaceae bacterium]
MNALKLKDGTSRKSAYDLRDTRHGREQVHTLIVVVDNEAGVLARVIGLFSARGYNIESLTVAEVDHQGHQSRITIVTSGSQNVIEQIMAQLDRMIPVHEVYDLSGEGPAVERELALLKVRGQGNNRVEALRLADIFRARVVDSTIESFIFEITGTTEKIDAFTDLMRPLGLIEIARTGIAGMSRGQHSGPWGETGRVAWSGSAAEDDPVEESSGP